MTIPSKTATKGPRMVVGVWNEVYPKVCGCSHQLSAKLVLFLDSSTPSMRKVEDRKMKAISGTTDI